MHFGIVVCRAFGLVSGLSASLKDIRDGDARHTDELLLEDVLQIPVRIEYYP